MDSNKVLVLSSCNKLFPLGIRSCILHVCSTSKIHTYQQQCCATTLSFINFSVYVKHTYDKNRYLTIQVISGWKTSETTIQQGLIVNKYN